MEPVSIAALVTAIVGIFSSLTGGAISRKKQQDFSVEMQNQTNEYNTPLNQKQRLEDAGYNPLWENQTVVPAANPVTGQSNSLDMSSISSLGSMLVETIANKGVKKAEEKNLDADTGKKQEEEKGLEIDNMRKAATLKNEIERSGLLLTQTQLENDLLCSNILNVEKNTDLLASQIQVNASIEKDLESQVNQRAFQQRLQDEMFAFDKLLKEKNFSLQEKYYVVQMLDSQCQRLLQKSQMSVNSQTARHIQQSISNLKKQAGLTDEIIKSQQIKNKLDDRYGDAERITGMVTQGLNSIANTVKAFKPGVEINKFDNRRDNRSYHNDSQNDYYQSYYQQGSNINPFDVLK